MTQASPIVCDRLDSLCLAPACRRNGCVLGRNDNPVVSLPATMTDIMPPSAKREIVDDESPKPRASASTDAGAGIDVHTDGGSLPSSQE